MRRRLLVGLAWEWLRGRGFGGLAPPRPEAEEAKGTTNGERSGNSGLGGSVATGRKRKKGKVGEGDLDRKFHFQWLKIHQIFFQQKCIIRHLNGQIFKVKCWICIHHTKHMLTTKCTTTCYVTTFNLTFL